MSATIKVFHVGEKRFQHVMDTAGERIELRDENDHTLLVFRERTRVFGPTGKIGEFVADFRRGIPHWLFFASGGKKDGFDGENDAPIDLGPDLFNAKVEVSRHYLSHHLPCASLPEQA